MHNRIFEKTVKETPITVRKQVLTERKVLDSNNFGLGGSPEGKRT